MWFKKKKSILIEKAAKPTLSRSRLGYGYTVHAVLKKWPKAVLREREKKVLFTWINPPFSSNYRVSKRPFSLVPHIFCLTKSLLMDLWRGKEERAVRTICIYYYM